MDLEFFMKYLWILKKNYDLSIILVSHDLDLVYKYSDSVALSKWYYSMFWNS